MFVLYRVRETNHRQENRDNSAYGRTKKIRELGHNKNTSKSNQNKKLKCSTQPLLNIDMHHYLKGNQEIMPSIILLLIAFFFSYYIL